MKKAVGCLLGAVLSLAVMAQQVGIGSKLDNETLSGVLNFTSSRIDLSRDFKGKSVILDFWNFRCTSCLSAFPKLDSLQKLFGDKLQIVLVNRESLDSTVAFFDKYKRIKKPQLPMITGAISLFEKFPPDAFPYHVWLDSTRTIRYMTGGYNTTKEKIVKFLNGDQLDVVNVQSSQEDPTVKVDSGLVYRSSLMPCVGAITNRHALGDTVNGGQHVLLAFNCMSVVDLLKRAFGEGGKYNFSRRYEVELNVADSFPYLFPKDPNLIDLWRKQYAFSYELILPSERAGERYILMQQDLMRYFDVEARVEQRQMKSFVLVRLPGVVTKKVRTPTSGGNLAFELKNQPAAQLINYLRFYLNKQPFFSEVAGDILVDVQITKRLLQPLDLPKLKEELKRFDIDIIEECRYWPVLTISKKRE